MMIVSTLVPGNTVYGEADFGLQIVPKLEVHKSVFLAFLTFATGIPLSW